MAKDRDDGTHLADVPHGHWYVRHGVMFRVVEHGLASDRVECRRASRHVQRRADKREIDNLGRKCEDSD